MSACLTSLLGGLACKQYPWLAFVDNGFERRYAVDSAKAYRLTRTSSLTFIPVLLAILLPVCKVSFAKAIILISGCGLAVLLLRGNFLRVMILLVALIPTLWETVETTEQTVLAFLPAFAIYGVLIKNWISCATCMCLSSIVTLLYHSPSLYSASLTIVIYSSLACFIERDFRDLWINYDTRRRDSLAHRNLFKAADNAVLIIKPDTTIVYANNRAKALVGLMRPRHQSQQRNELLNTLIKKCGGDNTIQIAVDQCMKGESVEFELNLSHSSRGKIEALGTFLTQVSPLSWRQANCFRISMTDISSVKNQRQLALTQTKETISNMKIAMKNFEDSYSNKEPVILNDIYRLNSAHHSLLNLLNMQMQAMNIVELALTHFNLKHEIASKIEESAYRALMKDVEIRLTYEPNLPKYVIGDPERIGQIIKSLFDFASKQARAKSAIQLVLGMQVNTT